MSSFDDALGEALGRVDQDNWRQALESLRDQAGSWKAVSERLGTDPRTVERWRHGYVDKKTHQRRQISDRTVQRSVVPKIKAALAQDRRAQLGAVDWKRLKITGTMTVAGDTRYVRHETMYVGRYLTDDSIAAISSAYARGDSDGVNEAINDAMADDYLGLPGTTLDDVEGLDFE